MTSLPVVAGTLQTDPRSGGIKRTSGVNVLPSVAEAWAEVRDDSNPSVDWIIVGYDGGSKTDITVIAKGRGGVRACSSCLPEATAVFGGGRLENGRFVSFFHADENTPTMQKGRASMHKNGVLNVLEGTDDEIDISRYHLVETMEQDCAEVGSIPLDEGTLASDGRSTEEVTVSDGAFVAEPEGPSSSAVPYEALKGTMDASELPPGVDPLNREKALSENEFLLVFGMDRDSFQALPPWKRTSMKKEKGLF